MSRSLTMLIAVVALAGCNTAQQQSRAPSPAVPAQTRALSPSEKALISAKVADRMKDPSSAQFKWMPIIEREREGIIDYCGLVNGKNSYGGYNGFARFYVHLKKENDGRLSVASVRGIENPAEEVSMFRDGAFSDNVCKTFGYVDFAQAQ